MITFIVIAKNHSVFLEKCLSSIVSFVKLDNLNYELIYVDSKSTEKNIQIAKKYNFKTISLNQDCNAAIARNIGAKYAKNENLVFMDGDMILNIKFAKKYLNNNFFSKHNYFSGDLLNHYHDKYYNFTSKGFYWRNALKNDKKDIKTGGLFCIKKEIWEGVNGMKNYYRRTQDNDFGLRLAKKNIFLLRKKDLFVTHLTISYTNKFRLFKILKNGDFFYRGLLYREHIFNKHILKLLFKTDYSLLALILSTIFFLVFKKISFLFCYILFVILRSFRTSLINNENFLVYLVYMITRDFQVFFSFLFFFPKKKKKISYDFK